MVCDYLKATIQSVCLNIMYLNYIHNVNTDKNVDLIKNEILTSIDKHKNMKTTFHFNSLKVLVVLKINQYKYMYPHYANILDFFRDIARITDNDLFMNEFRKEIFNCNDLFILYLINLILES